MQTIPPSELKRAMVLMLEGTPHILEDFHLTGTAQTRHRVHARLRHLKSGRILERVFAENERVAVAEMETRRVTYSYQQGGVHAFLDAETFEEFDLHADQIGERRWFLKENEEYKALLLEGKLLDIVFPPTLALKIVETAPPIRGGSDSTWKPAKLETGLEIMVPLFIANGETVRVDTATKKYSGKESGEK